MKTTEFNEVLNRFIGQEGSPSRNEFDADVEKSVEEYYMGLSIRDARKHKKMTQEQLGELVGVKKSQISRWEKGRSLSGSTLRKIFKAMEMPVYIKTDLGLYPISL